VEGAHYGYCIGDDFGGGGFVAGEPVQRDDRHGWGEGRRVERSATTLARSLNDPGTVSLKSGANVTESIDGFAPRAFSTPVHR